MGRRTPSPASQQGKASFVGGKIPRGADSVATVSSAPRSWALAATRFGGLRPGSLRVHDACKQEGHGSRLGFPSRRRPRDHGASANVARGLQGLLPWRDPGRRKPDVACLGRNPLLALSDIGRRTSDPELRSVNRELALREEVKDGRAHTQQSGGRSSPYAIGERDVTRLRLRGRGQVHTGPARRGDIAPVASIKASVSSEGNRDRLLLRLT